MPERSEHMPILFFSDIAWEHLYQRPQHIASRLAQRTPVLWIEPATLGAPRRWIPEKKGENLFLLTLPQFPHNARNRHIRRISRLVSSVPLVRWCLTQIQAFLLKRACRTLGITVAASPAFVENFQFAPLLRDLRPAAILFDYIDDAFGFIDYPAYVHAEWRMMLQLADRITATSGVLCNQIARETATPVTLIENGVNTASYDAAAARPTDLPGLGKPLIMYVGTVSHWFDFDLLDAILRGLPESNSVIVGPVHPDVAGRLNESRKFANLHVLGSRAHADIPAYLAAASTGIIPFIRNRLTEGVNPVKLYEYAAAGIPVVTTAFSDDLEAFRDVAFIARTHGSFIADLRTALRGGARVPDAGRLRQFARENDWDRRAAAIGVLIDDAMHRRESR
jgi:glycosyltransferase involved in cell wall biosynthesis